MDTSDTRIIVGMDAHSEKIQLCVTRWRGFRMDGRPLNICTTLDAMENTYRRQVPEGAVTVLEASTNSFSIVRRLEAIGHRAAVVASETLRGAERCDHINDAIDAKNLAVLYAAGRCREVFVPSQEFKDYRELFYCYEKAKKRMTAVAGHIWSFCSKNGFPLPPKSAPKKIKFVEGLLAGGALAPVLRMVLSDLLEDYTSAKARAEKYRRAIGEIALREPLMQRAMQAVGVGAVTAFALAAFIEDVRRFPSAKKLVAYLGLNPVVCESGTARSPRRLSGYGNSLLKALLIECAKSALRYGKEPIHKWARRKIAEGKHPNVVCCALARKMFVYLWHALRGDPAPSRETEGCYRGKLLKLVTAIGAARVKAMGYGSRQEAIDAVAGPLYAHLPAAPTPAGTAAARS